MQRKIVISSGNKNKVREIKEILKDLNIEVLSKSDLNIELDVLEDQDSLAANSKKKAIALREKLDCMVMADDSGLFVDYLDGAPGVYSSRYAGEEGNDKMNNEKLLREMKTASREERGARFISHICLIDEAGKIYQLEGVCHGEILQEERGQDGFGYDPLFQPEGYNESFAQMSPELKNKISHRYKALKALRQQLEDLV